MAQGGTDQNRRRDPLVAVCPEIFRRRELARGDTRELSVDDPGRRPKEDPFMRASCGGDMAGHSIGGQGAQKHHEEGNQLPVVLANDAPV